MTTDSSFRSPSLWFQIFKYAIYCLLAYNVWLFFLKDLAASAQIFSGQVSWQNAVEAYSASIDTLAWVILLLMFELETAVISDEKLSGTLKWGFSGLRGLCYLFIAWSFYGYIIKYGVVTDFSSLNIADVCALVGTDFTFAHSLDDYLPLTPETCAAMQSQDILQITGTKIIGTTEQLALAGSLALTDIINAGDWLVIVAILEIEVLLQVKGALSERMLKTNKYVKGCLYTVLFACAVYWGIDGQFLYFWDAFLWLVAFLFIEMNIFNWHAETSADQAAR